MGIAVSGLASGIDSDSIISQLMSVERRPLFKMQTDIARLEAKKAAYADLDSRLRSLRSAADRFNDGDLFGQISATSGDTSVVTATASSEAATGTHRVEVHQVASAHRVAAQGFVDESTSAISAAVGAFKFKVGDGDEQTVDVSTSTTLRQLADAINSTGASIHADIVNDGSPTSAYRLVLSSTEAGTDGIISITSNSTSLDFDNPTIEAATADSGNAATYLGAVTSSGTYAGGDNSTYIVEIIQDGDASGGAGAARYRFSTDSGQTFDDNGGAGYVVDSAGPLALGTAGVEINFTDNGALADGDTFRIDAFDPDLQSAQDAVVSINGITVVKQTNTIDDVFDGITLNLQSASSGSEINVSVSRDAGDVQGALTGFIGAYNSVVGFLNAQFSYSPEEADGQAAPALNGDSAARQIQGRLKNFVTGRLPGLTGATMSALSELGIDSNEETGLVSLDTGKLTTALSADPTAVERLLTRFAEVQSGDLSYVRRSSSTQPGTYDVEITQARTRAEVTGTQAASTIAGGDETLTVTYDTGSGAPDSFDVVLQNGDTADVQITRLNGEFDSQNVALSAFLDTSGQIAIRADTYGSDYTVTVESDTAVGAGTSGIGDALISDEGTDLAGKINGHAARVLDGTHLKGATGFAEADLEVIVPDDATIGMAGTLRVADGLGESLPELVDGLASGMGILGSRTEGVNRRITNIEDQLSRSEDRLGRVEERLRRRFVALEVTMGQLSALGDYVSQQMASLPSVGGSRGSGR